VLPHTELHYFNMNKKETKLNGQSESRFGSMIFLLRLAGIPLRMKKISNVYAVYMIAVIVCDSTIYLGMLGDVYVHRYELGRAMTSIRALFSFTNAAWLFSICR
jgi:hypothetical protein